MWLKSNYFPEQVEEITETRNDKRSNNIERIIAKVIAKRIKIIITITATKNNNSKDSEE